VPPSPISIAIGLRESAQAARFFLWIIIAGLNALFYAGVAAVVTRRLRNAG
jgi:hypothetical protein